MPAALEEDRGSLHSSQPATPALGGSDASSGPCVHVHTPVHINSGTSVH